MVDETRAGAAYGGDPFSEDPSVIPAQTPFWREGLFALDWLALRSSGVYYGCGVEHGRGQPVILIPGFLARDLMMAELFRWLTRIGYEPYFSNIEYNADCPNHLTNVVLETVRIAQQQTGQRPVLIGHSLGGMIARTIALEYPERVAGVISMGSPFKDAVRAHPSVISAADALRRSHNPQRPSTIGAHLRPACFSGHCTCTFVRQMLAPDQYEVPHFAIYSRTDGVVEWEACAEDDASLNEEVTSTHLGMAFHPGVYRALAKRIAQAFRARAATPAAIA